MIDLGKVRPGSTLRIPFSTFDKDDGSSITMTNYAAADLLVYKDGSTTERASTSGFTATTDFDSKTGKHLAIFDLADNTTAGFWNAGSEYLVAVDAVTVDLVTTGGWIARFTIGYPDALFDTTIATLASQTSFTLTVGPAEDDALNGCTVIIHDIASAVQCGLGVIQDYTGASKTVTLAAGTTFTAAAGDNISILRPHPLQAAAEKILAAGRTLLVDATGNADARLADAVSHGGTLDSSTATLALSRINATSQTANTSAITATGNGTGHGITASSGSGATGNGITATAASTNGNGVSATGTGTGNGLLATGGAGAGGDGFEAAAGGGVPIRGNITGNLSGSVGSVTGNVGGNVSGSVGSVTANVNADVVKISGDTAVADALEALMDGTIVAQVNGVATTTSIPADGFTEATDDHFNGRLITFISGAMLGQQTAITDYTGGTQTFTVTALTEAPADNVFFVIH